ncbi:Pycsar system effector family protein [Algoriphagus hitonicola]|uniref:Predicted metal-dependent phosphohydrolase, HD superfamily n=1 Tax=Algoriphagus hitonicola TaxID=435880 RepID=A0A1I2SVK9_9BACT|nr:Pycsar system effector family protein [Algoriphagus hitonicola]SFG56945.1 Predicted metal-dependent phosphohydrolase, HD superfamily [Algoriphagus hitonicola]
MENLREKFESWIREMFHQRLKEEVCYHNLDHTLLIVEKSREIAGYEGLEGEELDDLFFAAWLHDTGYWEGKAEGHEQRGAELAQSCLSELGIAQQRIDRIKSAILATKVPQNPQNLFEKILCDADMYHLSTPEFLTYTMCLRQEMENLHTENCTKLEWLKKSREFTLSHRYHTEYGKKHLEPLKLKNLTILEKEIEELENQKFKPEKKKNKKSDRGIETMFRVTSTNHLELSALADNKANIMISVNSIIISIVVTVLIRKLEEFPNYTIPAILLISTCLGAMIFAILATRPKVTKGLITKENIEKKQGNLLYFGNFHQMSIEDYSAGIRELMEDSDYLYGTMTRDIYFLGKVLAKKYKLLRKSYTVFMFGFVVSVLSFLIATLFFDPFTY